MSDNSNKMKRETWLNQKTKKIKEQTVKSLEQEVEKLMRKHNMEVAELKSKHKREMEEQGCVC